VTCWNPLEHQGHLVWKCHYCCKPSTYLCYCDVHFCNNCHSCNSKQVRTSTTQSTKPPPLSPIPCPGANCPYPKPPQGPSSLTSPTSSSYHSNGPTIKSEQVCGCMWCQSAMACHGWSKRWIFPSMEMPIIMRPQHVQMAKPWYI